MVRDKAWLTNGDSTQAVMSYDGATLVELDGTAGKPNPARGKYILYALNRVWMINTDGRESDTDFSALFNSSGVAIEPDDGVAWPAANVLEIAKNDGDQLFGGLLWSGTVFFFKAKSIHRLSGVDEQNFVTLPHALGIGTRFRRTIAITDNVPHFLGPDGVYAMPGGVPRNITRLIQPDFDDILQVDVRTRFRRWSDKIDFDAGTFVDTRSDGPPGSIILGNGDNVLLDNFTVGLNPRWQNTSGYITETSFPFSSAHLARSASNPSFSVAQSLQLPAQHKAGLWRFSFRSRLGQSINPREWVIMKMM